VSVRRQETWDVELVRAGQPQPYADHEHVYRVTATRYGVLDGKPMPYFADPDSVEWTAQCVRRARHLVAGDLPDFGDRPGEGMTRHFHPYVDYAKAIEPGVVEVRTVDPYID